MSEPTINFPNSLDTYTSLLKAVNNAKTILLEDLPADANITTIKLKDASRFPESGYITITDAKNNEGEYEVIYYPKKIGNTLINCTRGADDTSVLSHFKDAKCYMYIISKYHNLLVDAIISIENTIGLPSGSEDVYTMINGIIASLENVSVSFDNAIYATNQSLQNHIDNNNVSFAELDTKIDNVSSGIHQRITNEVAALIDSSPETLDTLNELAAALGDDANFATNIINQISNVSLSLDQEIISSQNADNNLQTQIDNVSSTLTDHITNHPLGSVFVNVSDQYYTSLEVDNIIDNVSSSFNNNLLAETTARQNADDNLQTQIDNVSSALSSASGTLEETLANGNNTGSNDIIIDSGQKLVTNLIESSTGNDLYISSGTDNLYLPPAIYTESITTGTVQSSSGNPLYISSGNDEVYMPPITYAETLQNIQNINGNGTNDLVLNNTNGVILIGNITTGSVGIETNSTGEIIIAISTGTELAITPTYASISKPLKVSTINPNPSVNAITIDGKDELTLEATTAGSSNIVIDSSINLNGNTKISNGNLEVSNISSPIGKDLTISTVDVNNSVEIKSNKIVVTDSSNSTSGTTVTGIYSTPSQLEVINGLVTNITEGSGSSSFENTWEVNQNETSVTEILVPMQTSGGVVNDIFDLYVDVVLKDTGTDKAIFRVEAFVEIDNGGNPVIIDSISHFTYSTSNSISYTADFIVQSGETYLKITPSAQTSATVYGFVRQITI